MGLSTNFSDYVPLLTFVGTLIGISLLGSVLVQYTTYQDSRLAVNDLVHKLVSPSYRRRLREKERNTPRQYYFTSDPHGEITVQEGRVEGMYVLDSHNNVIRWG